MVTKHGLYNIMGTLITNNVQKFCPIQLEIANEKLLKKENKGKVEAEWNRYLLQVWTKKGIMIYERRMKQPVLGWCL